MNALCSGRPRPLLRRAILPVLLLVAGALWTPRPASAEASPAQAAATEGAGHFKAKRYLEAARAFERSYQLEPTDPVLLRYAGRAWQEVGHLGRAKRLLERYLELEKNAARRSSIEPKLARLRGLDKTALAEALVEAARKHPGGGLEAEAAFALEELDDPASLARALKHWELARTLAKDSGVRVQCDSGIRRVKRRMAELEKGAAPAPQPTPVPTPVPTPTPPPSPAPPEATGSSGLTVALYVIGAVGLVGGAGMAGYGFIQADNANKAFKEDADKLPAKRTYSSFEAYEKDKKGADTMAYIGYGVAGVGAIATVWAIARTATSGPAAADGSGVRPWVGSGGRGGLLWSVRF